MLLGLKTAIVKPPDLWSTSTNDTVLAEGDKLYSSLAEMKNKQYLLIDELPKRLIITDEHFEIEYGQALSGSLFKDMSAEGPYCDLEKALEVAETVKVAFLTIGQMTPA